MSSAPDIPAASKAAPHLAYRRDIDGLRAIAVGAVVLYHFGVAGFGSGFVGVDIFFVISGFLITSILLGDFEKGGISLVRFYERRVRRILPALFAMMAICLLVGLALLPPRALDELGRSILAAISFVSNIYFWRSTSGYFDGPAETRPMLHTWSLGVEEQFYIFFPIALAILLRFGRRFTAIMAAIGLIAALAISAWLTPRFPDASFYLSPTRAWQLLVGALLALHPLQPGNRWMAEGASAAGLALIVFAVVALGGGTPTSGLAGLFPCLGAILLIYAGAGPHAGLVTRLISTRPFVAVGLISYSLYLWHWPIYVFLRHYILFEPLSPLFAVLGIAAAFVMAFLSWRFVEQPIRRRAILDGRGRLFAAAAIVAVLLASGAGAMLALKGAPGRFPDMQLAAMQDEPPRPDWAPYNRRSCFSLNPGWKVETCTLVNSGPNAPVAMLWGDSYSGNYVAGLLDNADNVAPTVIHYSAPRCPPVIGYDPVTNRECAPFNERGLEVIEEQNVQILILAARWESYISGGKMTVRDVANTIEAFQDQGLEVILVGQSPVYYFDFPEEYYLARLRNGAGGENARAENSINHELNDALREAAGSAAFFDPTEPLCDGRSCLYRANGSYVVGDSGHMTQDGSHLVTSELVKLPLLAGGAPE